MSLAHVAISVFRPQPPPLWFVTNGELTVGPVVTGLLMRGVEHGRVPEYCHVRQPRGDWRAVVSVREIAALSGKPGSGTAGQDNLAEWWRLVERVRDEQELSHTLAWLALVATGAECAMFHLCGRQGRSLVTRSVVGPMSNDRLGYALPEHDLVVQAARQGRPVVGPPYGPTEDALAKRMASSQGGVGAAAMIPVFVDQNLTAMVELARPGHPFRRNDLQRVERMLQRTLRLRSN